MTFTPQVLDGASAYLAQGLPVDVTETVPRGTIYAMDLGPQRRVVMHPEDFAALEYALFLREIRQIVRDGVRRAFPDLRYMA